eukprot:TRINITY_DN2103_c0_g1_i1.p1 TRINITY_DN2103_c0_g1~~TRINITY_DN2103_c0_g1_i1.p1  ORF type:complete len:192 (-),score=30.38 TRINITY_DN2103_c0_g1_i1:105-680(-)
MQFLAFNNLAQERVAPLRIPVSSSNVQVFDSSKNIIPSQISPGDNPYPQNFQEDGTQPFKVVFEATLPPLGFTTYFLEISENSDANGDGEPMNIEFDGEVTLENDHILVEFDDVTGKIASVTNKQEGITTNVNQDWFFYKSYAGEGQASGAYISDQMNQNRRKFQKGSLTQLSQETLYKRSTRNLVILLSK